MYDTNWTFIDDHGQRCYHLPTTFTAAERQQLIDAGLQPNTFVSLTHAETISQLHTLAATIDLRQAADAFVASLVSRDLAWRTVLPATALGLATPVHDPDLHGMGGGYQTCRICFSTNQAIDRTQGMLFRHRQGSGWGADHPVEGVLTLQQLVTQRRGGDWPQPTPRDSWVFSRILAILRQLPPTARYTQACTAIKAAQLLQVNQHYRYETLLEALAFVGVLETPEYPGLLTRFTTAVVRDQRPHIRVEVPAPLAWWTAAHGLNEPLVARLFGHLTCPPDEPSRPPAVRSTTRRSRTRLPKAIPGPVAAGDVYAVRYREDLWGAVYGHAVDTDHRGIVRGRVEYLDVLTPTPPTAAQIAGCGYRDRYDGRYQVWCSGLDQTMGVRRMAVAIAPPPHAQPIPDRIATCAAAHLRHLTSGHFAEV